MPFETAIAVFSPAGTLPCTYSRGCLQKFPPQKLTNFAQKCGKTCIQPTLNTEKAGISHLRRHLKFLHTAIYDVAPIGRISVTAPLTPSVAKSPRISALKCQTRLFTQTNHGDSLQTCHLRRQLQFRLTLGTFPCIK